MAPTAGNDLAKRVYTGKPENPNGLVLEAWAREFIAYMCGGMILSGAD